MNIVEMVSPSSNWLSKVNKIFPVVVVVVTTRECGVVIFSVPSVCLSVCLSFLHFNIQVKVECQYHGSKVEVM